MDILYYLLRVLIKVPGLEALSCVYIILGVSRETVQKQLKSTQYLSFIIIPLCNDEV